MIGNAGTGKSKILRSLNKTYANMKLKPVWVDLNPKAVTTNELFGYINPATREWKDGEGEVVWSCNLAPETLITWSYWLNCLCIAIEHLVYM